MTAHILVVDDNPDVQCLEHRRLERLGFAVTTCSNGHGALDALQQAPKTYDALIVDYHMPRINGIEVARRLREQGHEHPIVLMSGRRSDLSRYQSHVGFDAFLPKPVSGDELIEVMSQLLS